MLKTEDKKIDGTLYYNTVDITSFFTPFETSIYNIMEFFTLAFYPICFILCVAITSILFYKKQLQKPFEILDNAAEKNPNIKVVAVEPATSPVLSKGISGAHKIQGIGAGFIPDILNTKVYDEVITIENEDAFIEGKAFAVSEGILVGISSGAALKAAAILAKRPENKDKIMKIYFLMLYDLQKKIFL